MGKIAKVEPLDHLVLAVGQGRQIAENKLAGRDRLEGLGCGSVWHIDRDIVRTDRRAEERSNRILGRSAEPLEAGVTRENAKPTGEGTWLPQSWECAHD